MKKGQTPSVALVADLAAYLGVSVSDLVGDTKTPAELAPLAAGFDSRTLLQTKETACPLRIGGFCLVSVCSAVLTCAKYCDNRKILNHSTAEFRSIC